MAYTQIFENQTFPPGSTFPENCYFKGCTFQATCTFGEGCMFDGCTFQKCCYPQYQNPPSEVKSSIVVKTTLESVNLDKNTLGVDNVDTGYKVQDQSYKRAPHNMGSAGKYDTCNDKPIDPCKGFSLSPEAEKPEPLSKDCKPKCEKRGYEEKKD